MPFFTIPVFIYTGFDVEPDSLMKIIKDHLRNNFRKTDFQTGHGITGNKPRQQRSIYCSNDSPGDGFRDMSLIGLSQLRKPKNNYLKDLPGYTSSLHRFSDQ